MNDLEKIESDIDNLIEIYMPKLRHVENSGNGDTIHQVRSHILLIESSRHNSKYWKETNNIEKYSYSIRGCLHYITCAIKFLEDLAK